VVVKIIDQFDLDTSQRAIMLGIQQMAELGQLLVDRALEQVSPSAQAVPNRD